jgi:hypothetical protein
LLEVEQEELRLEEDGEEVTRVQMEASPIILEGKTWGFWAVKGVSLHPWAAPLG